MNTIFATREVADNGTITIYYSFGTVVARRSIKSDNMVSHAFELKVPTKDGKRAHSILLNGYYLSVHDEWLLLSGIEEAARNAIEHYRECFSRKVQELDRVLGK